MNTERLIHNMPQCSTIDLSASSIWKTTESHHDRWVKLSCENTGMCLSYVPFTLVIRLINCWDVIQIWYDNKMLSSQWDNNNQHFVYIIVSWFLLGIITCQGVLFSCSCMNRCTCFILDTLSSRPRCLCDLRLDSHWCCSSDYLSEMAQPWWVKERFLLPTEELPLNCDHPGDPEKPTQTNTKGVRTQQIWQSSDTYSLNS